MKKLFISGACFGLFLSVMAGTTAFSQSTQLSQSGSGDLSALVARQQLRMDTIENGLKDIRGTIEVELRDIRTKLDQLSATALAGQSEASVDVKQFQAELTRLTDSIDILNQRITRTLELTSDVEFRVLRLEKRMQTLMSLSGDELTGQLAQQDVTAGSAPPAVSIGRDNATGETVWTIEKDDLDAHLDGDNKTDSTAEAATQTTTQDGQTAPAETTETTAAELPGTDEGQDEAQQDQPAEPAAPEFLPDASPEDQYRFALARALQNDLKTAENAFVEFGELHPDHERAVDALFWQGRVQFIQGQFEKAATTFSKFNALYSTDPRISDTTLWIAESVAKFANAEQACTIYENLGQFLDQPPESFVARLAELSASAGCSS